MRKGLLLMVALAVMVSVVFADDYMLPGPQKRMAHVRDTYRVTQPSRPDTAIYSFSIAPVNLLFSYWDYMIGSYNDIPLCVQPDPAYGGYFLTFQGSRTATGQRRVFYAYISDTGTVESMNEITAVNIREGYPSIAVDPVSGIPLYAWHGNVDGVTDEEFEVSFAWDDFLFGLAGLISPPSTVINNPTTVQPFGSADNEFIWPTVQIGPSPMANMRRVYVLAKNTVTHTTYPSGNVRIAYADFNRDMLNAGTIPVWNYTSIPTLDAWNHDTALFRRPFMAFTVGNDGRIYYMGYHVSGLLPDGELVEPDLNVFVSDNYGQGAWTRHTGWSTYPSWNPRTNFGSGPGFFDGSDNLTPVPDDSLFWAIGNSSHLNAVMDEANDKIHVTALWAQYFRELNAGIIDTYYHPNFQTVKNLVFDTNDNTFSIREIYPKAGHSSDDNMWLPWDEDADGLVDEFWDDDPQDPDYGWPKLATTWPFPYWDSTVHNNAMMFHYNNFKTSQPNAQGMMASVWQDANRARIYNQSPADYPELAPFVDTPEIWISVSPDFGVSWSEPFSLNKVETPALAGMKPMWAYPADVVKYVGTTPEGREIGKLGLLFYDDVSWGAAAIDGPVGLNLGGYVRFAELNITFPLAEVSTNEQVVVPAITMLRQNFPNPFNPETTISFIMPKGGHANLSIYNTKGQLVKTLVNELKESGEHKLVWRGIDNNGRQVSSGLYFYKLNANGRTETRKMVLMK